MKTISTKSTVTILVALAFCTILFFFKETRLENSIFFFSIFIGIVLIKNSIKEDFCHKNSLSAIKESENMNDRLKELDNLKTEFVSLASHQLRSPLAKIQGYSSMILEGEYGKIQKELKEPLQRIFLSSQNLGALLNDFLDVAQIEKGETIYNLKPCNIIEILNKIEESFKDVFDNTELDLQISYDRDSEIQILADERKMFSALSKLIDNAVRYTPKGNIKISVAENADDVIVTIKDTGIGISQSEIDELFEKFKRGKNSYNTSVSGSGLGLYVSKEIIESQEGKIWLKSDGEGRGTTAFVAFPVLRN